VVEETKRLRHKSGLAEEQELFQYVLYDTLASQPARKGPRRINLDDPEPKGKSRSGAGSGAYAPPTNLVVHLSKIDMPDLRPRAEVHKEQRRAVSDVQPAHLLVAQEETKHKDHKDKKDKKTEKAEKEREKAQRRLEEERRKAEKKRPPEPSKLNKPSSPPRNYHIPAHQVHPYQPSPSPSQLNNPAIYAAPPPRRPSHTPSHSLHAPPASSMAFPSPGGFYAPGGDMPGTPGYLPHAPNPASPTGPYDPARQSYLAPPPPLAPRPGSAPAGAGSSGPVSDFLHALSLRH